MLPRVNPIKTKQWQSLKKIFNSINSKRISDFFESDKNRVDKYSINFEDLYFDFSKNIIDDEVLDLLISLAEECKLKTAIELMFTGAKINETENRAVLHTALRNKNYLPEIMIDGKNIYAEIKDVQHKMKSFSEDIISGNKKSFSGKNFTDIVNIGIGGSDLGPAMVYEALTPYHNNLNVHFVSNIDGTHISQVLKKLTPENTLFIIVSKTFTTQETITNAQTAKDWVLKHTNSTKAIEKNFVAVSTNIKLAKEFGIAENNIFRMWDWVGGRYSLWSAVGLSIACGVGYKNFEKLLSGAFKIDTHFRNSEFKKNIPVILALIGIWYNNFFNAQSYAILPYNQNLKRFPAYLQQADMESNGKSVDRNGDKINYQTGPIIWGEAGTNGQHAFYQLIHQGTKLIPADFIGFSQSHYKRADHQLKLTANLIAQTEALMKGKSKDEVYNELKLKQLSEKAIQEILSFKIFDGNKPTNTLLFKKLTPKTLGMLIAIYEHKIFVQGIIWNIFSFDQWGVELGKALAKNILIELKENNHSNLHDKSTAKIINLFSTQFNSN